MSGEGRRVPLTWQLARLMVGGSRRQAFLDRAWIPWLLRSAPPSQRRRLALHTLSFSLHYFVYQWDRYPAAWKRDRVLEAEFERIRRSRREIAQKLLEPVLRPDATALDFGCGPGFLAAEVCGRVRDVIALDVSAGTLACARELNPGPSYVLSRDTTLPLGEATVDVVYSVAVFQHIDPADWPAYFGEFFRVLRPGGRGLCHFPIADARPITSHEPTGLRGCYSLRFRESTSEAVQAVLADSRFVDIRVAPVAEMAVIDDDVGRQHVATFRKPG